MTGILVDTNVLVYTVDPSESGKRGQAIAAVDRLVLRGVAV